MAVANLLNTSFFGLVFPSRLGDCDYFGGLIRFGFFVLFWLLLLFPTGVTERPFVPVYVDPVAF
jgi:hypothetical protein